MRRKEKDKHFSILWRLKPRHWQDWVKVDNELKRWTNYRWYYKEDARDRHLAELQLDEAGVFDYKIGKNEKERI